MLQKKPFVVLDVAANIDAIENLALQLHAFCQQNNITRVVAAVGLLADKVHADLLSTLRAYVDSWCVVGVHCSDFPQRSTDADSVRIALGIQANSYPNAHTCWQKEQTHLTKQDLFLVFGSFYLLADFYKNTTVGRDGALATTLI